MLEYGVQIKSNSDDQNLYALEGPVKIMSVSSAPPGFLSDRICFGLSEKCV